MIIKGTKAVYKVNSNNEYELVSQRQRGNDLVLTVDDFIANLFNYLKIQEDLTIDGEQFHLERINKIRKNEVRLIPQDVDNENLEIANRLFEDSKKLKDEKLPEINLEESVEKKKLCNLELDN